MSAPAEELSFSEPIDIGALLGKLIAKRWWIIGCVLVFSLAFGVVAYTMKPVYRAAVVLTSTNAERGADVLGFSSSPLGGLASGLGLGPKDAETEEALAVLRSRQFTESFISSQNLMPQLFADKWNPATATWKTDVKHPPTPSKAYKYFDTTIRSIVQDRKTGLVTIQIDWTDRNEAAAWANELVSELNEEMRARAIAKAEASRRFLDKEAQTTSTVEAHDAISRLIEAQIKQRMLANVTRDYSFRVVDKAMPSDSDDQIKPHKRILILVGALLGLVVGITAVLLVDSFGRRRA
jgi:uncharacterized protein involved in exopolysaccharide biosynthesis